MATTSTGVLGAQSAVTVEQLQREAKRQQRGAVNALAQTAGELDDDALAGVIAVDGDLVGYLPAITPVP